MISILVKLMNESQGKGAVSGRVQDNKMEKLEEGRFQEPSSQGRERLRVELFKDRLAQSTVRVETATKIEYARDGREERKKREKKSKDARACLRLTDRRNTDVYRHPVLELTRHPSGGERLRLPVSVPGSLISVLSLPRVIGA